MQRNRESAARSRNRKREHLDQLENTVALLQAQVAQLSSLKSRVESLETENSALRKDLQSYKERDQMMALSSTSTQPQQIISQCNTVSPENSFTGQFVENNLLPTDSPFLFNPIQDFFSSNTIKEESASNILPEQSFLNESSNCTTFSGLPDVKYATLNNSLQSRSGNQGSLVLLYHLLMMVQVWTFLSGQFGVFLANLCDQMKKNSRNKAKRMSAANNRFSHLSNGSQTSRLPPLLLLPPVPTRNGQAHPSSVHYFRPPTNPSVDTFFKHQPP